MKRTGLILLISGFWLLVSGYYTNTHAQDETLEIITYYPAPYGVYNRLQIGSNPANGILFEPSDASPNAGYIRFGDHTGWKLHFGRYSESAGGAANTGTTGVLMTIQGNGNIGIGTTNPTSILGLNGNAWRRIGMERKTFSDGGSPLTIQAGGAYSGGTNLPGGDLYLRSGISTGDMGSRIHFSTATPGTSGTSDHNPSIKMEILGNGNVGIGTVNPSSLLHVSAGTSGDAVFRLEADTINSDENDNPAITLFQDGGLVNAFIGLEGSAGTRSAGTLANAFVIGSEDNNPALQFVTNDSTRMTILTNGNVGIGTNNPIDDLVIGTNLSGMGAAVGTAVMVGDPVNGSSLYMGQNGSNFINMAWLSGGYGRIYTQGGPLVLQQYGGRVGIGITPTANVLEVNGNASKSAAGDWLVNSDIRIKTDIHDLDNALSVINKLHPVKFRYKDEYRIKYESIEDRNYCNFIAQEYKEVFPESVKDDGEGYLQIDTHNVKPYLVAAVQELSREMDKLKAENNILEEKNNELEARIKALEEKMITK